MKQITVRPIRRFVLLLDDQPGEFVTPEGLVVSRGFDNVNLDYYVVSVGTDEDCGFGSGDRVVLGDPNAGRKVRLDGIVYRVVRTSDVVAVLDPGRSE